MKIHKRVPRGIRLTTPKIEAAMNEKDELIAEYKRPREWWLNVYQDMDWGIHESREIADEYACSYRTECIHVREVMP